MYIAPSIGMAILGSTLGGKGNRDLQWYELVSDMVLASVLCMYNCSVAASGCYTSLLMFLSHAVV